MQTGDGGYGYAGRLEGVLDIQPSTAKITRFRAYAEGPVFGARGHIAHILPQNWPLMLAFVEAKDDNDRAVPPFGTYGDFRGSAPIPSWSKNSPSWIGNSLKDYRNPE